MKFYGVFLSIILDKVTLFTSNFLMLFQERLGIKVNFSTAFNPHTDVQDECTIKTLEEMLGECVIDFNGNWNDHPLLIEFFYNNNYHSSIAMATFEALYGRRC